MDVVAGRLVSVSADVHRGRLYGFGERAETVPVHTLQGRHAQSSAAFLRAAGSEAKKIRVAFQPMLDQLDRAVRELGRHPVMRAAMEAQRMREEREGRVPR